MHKLFLMVFAALTLSACGVEGSVDAFDTESALRGNANGQFCGGFAGIECPDGYQCVDDPSDGCDPNAGGADCAGVCEKVRGGGGGGKKDCERKRNQYLGDAEQCLTLRFICDSGEQPFFDDCGCGCEPIPGEVCGDSVCPDGEVCCNASCGICTPPGGVCTQQACIDEPVSL
jgi:hypothetical protein